MIFVSIIIAIAFNERKDFVGALIKDGMFFLMSLFFVSVFFAAMLMLRQAMHQVRSIKHYINEPVMKLQLAIFTIFLIIDTAHNGCEEALFYIRGPVKPKPSPPSTFEEPDPNA